MLGTPTGAWVVLADWDMRRKCSSCKQVAGDLVRWIVWVSRNYLLHIWRQLVTEYEPRV